MNFKFLPYVTSNGGFIFHVHDKNDSFFLTLSNMKEYYDFLSNSKNFQTNQNTLQQWMSENNISCYKSLSSIELYEESKTIAYLNLILPNEFQNTLEKHALGYLFYTDETHLYIFKESELILNELFKKWGQKFSLVNFYLENNLFQLQNIIKQMHKDKKITPLFTFEGNSFNFLKEAIKESEEKRVQFLNHYIDKIKQ
jgi:hypothetical protein